MSALKHSIETPECLERGREGDRQHLGRYQPVRFRLETLTKQTSGLQPPAAFGLRPRARFSTDQVILAYVKNNRFWRTEYGVPEGKPPMAKDPQTLYTHCPALWGMPIGIRLKGLARP